MPPKRSRSSQNSVEQEGRILLALQSLQNGQVRLIRADAALYSVPRSTLTLRAKGIVSRGDTRANSHKLTQLEEDSLVQWIFSINSRGAAPRPSTVREIANILLAARGITPPPTVGVNWSLNFVKRRDELLIRFSRRYDYQRALNEDPRSLRAWFATV